MEGGLISQKRCKNWQFRLKGEAMTAMARFSIALELFGRCSNDAQVRLHTDGDKCGCNKCGAKIYGTVKKLQHAV